MAGAWNVTLQCDVAWQAQYQSVLQRSTKYYSALQNKISVIQSKVLVRTTTYVSVVQSKYYSVCYKDFFPYNKGGALVWVRFLVTLEFYSL